MANDFENASSTKNLLIDSLIRKKQIILMGGDMEKEKSKISPEQIKKLKQDYIAMYFALCAVNWCRGGSLGSAWQKGLEQMDAFVDSKKKIANHPINEHILEIHSQHRKIMAKEIMTGKHSDDKINMSPEAAKKWADMATKRFGEKMSALNGLYQQYMPKKIEIKHANANKFDMASKQVQQMMQKILLQKLNQQKMH